MAINQFEAAYFSEFAYRMLATDLTLSAGEVGNPEAVDLGAEGWVELGFPFQNSHYTDGYFGRAFVKIVDGVAVDLVIAHRGTEFDTVADLTADGQIITDGLIPNDQVDNAKAFTTAVKNAFASQSYATGVNVDEITTHTGHSLGGYLAIHASDEQSTNSGISVDAITFDNPRTGLNFTTANVTTYLNSPNIINTTGDNGHLGTVYNIGTSVPSLDPDAMASLNLMVAKAADYGFSNPSILAIVLSLPFAIPTFATIGYPAANQTITDHRLASIISRLDDAEVVSPYVNYNNADDALKYYLVGNYAFTDNVSDIGGIGLQQWNQYFSDESIMTLQQYADNLLSLYDDTSFNYNTVMDDVLLGTTGNDNLGDSRDNIIVAFGGDDTINAAGGENIIDGGLGVDTLDYSGFSDSQGVDVDLGAGNTYIGEFVGGTPKDTFDNIENVTGSSYDDIILGDNVANHLVGGAGNDDLDGGAGNDILDGGAGDDVLYGSIDNDTLLGDTGNDTLDGGTGDDQLTGGTGVDTYQFSSSNFGNDTIIDDDGNLVFNNKLLSGQAKEVPNATGTYSMTSGGKIFIIKEVEGTNDITITNSLNNVITIKDYVNNIFNIELVDIDDQIPPEIDDEIGEAIEAIEEAKLNPPPRPVDPLVFDIDGDGIELVSVNDSTAFFDLDGDGFAEKTGWVAPDDALLAIDRNGSWSIDNIDELFGNETTSGLEELAELDTNLDGVIDSSDDDFNQLRLWQDLNQNGVSESNELKTLQQMGVLSISLNGVESNSLVEGNLISETSEYALTSGDTRIVADVDFQLDQVQTITVGDGGTGGGISILTEALLFPHSRGYGNLAAWHIAMTNNSALLTKMQELTQLPLDRFDELEGLVEEFLYEWAGATSVDPTSRGSFIDARKLAFIEDFTGEAYLQDGDPDPNAFGAERLEAAWGNILETMSYRILFQGNIEMLVFLDKVSYDFQNDKLDFAGNNPTDLINYAKVQDIGAQDIAEEIFALTEFLNILEFYFSDFDKNAASSAMKDKFGFEFKGISLGNLGNTYIADSGGATINADDGNNYIVGSDGNDVIYGNYGKDFITGGDGNDIIYGGDGRDSLLGGKGDDTLIGGESTDSYYYNLDDGDDTIITSQVQYRINNNGNKIFFGEGITLADTVFEKSGNKLIITFLNASGSITIENQFDGAYKERDGINDITFFDGTVINTASDISYSITGTSGNDTLFGFFGDDTLEGGTGDDTLIGSNGSDTYIFNLGDGNDIITEDGHGPYIDRIILGAGILPEDVAYQSIGDDLLIQFANGTDSITIINHFLGYSSNRVEELHFNDGTIFDLNNAPITGTEGNDTIAGSASGDIINALGGDDYVDTGHWEGDDIVDGGAGDDEIHTYDGNDILIGGTGNDSLYGEDDDDTYIFNRGDGDDTIYEKSGNDIIIFGPGILFSDLVLSGQGVDLLITINGGATTESILVKNHLTYSAIEELHFDDGSIEDISSLDLGIDGTAGDDNILASDSDDIIDGLSGNDIINARSGNDIITGGMGDDTLIGGGNDDTYIYNLGDGNDLIDEDYNTSNPGMDTIQFGEGVTQENIIISPDGNDLLITFDGEAGSIRVKGHLINYYARIETLRFSDGSEINMDLYGIDSFDDNIEGTGQADIIDGRGGNDSIYGKLGDDIIYGGDGDDYIAGDAGDDQLYGGAGNDIIRYATSGSNHGNDLYDGGDGDDILEGSQSLSSTPTYTTFIGGKGDDIITSSKRAYNTYIFAPGDGNDTIYKDSSITGEDIIMLTGGITPNDVVLSKELDQNGWTSLKISFVNSTDSLFLVQHFSGYQIDSIHFDDGSVFDLSVIIPGDINGTEGNDTIYATTADDFVNGLGGDDYIVGIDGNDTLNGGADNDTLVGGNDNDILNAGDGDDILRGGNDNDMLFGGDGDDLLEGENHDDTLNGGAGNDYLEGGGGDDIYIFESGSGVDVIEESSGFDRIVLPDGITSSDISFAIRGGNNGELPYGEHLLITINGTQDSILIKSQLVSSSNPKVEEINFSDGSVFDLINNLPPITMYGTEGDDDIEGNYGYDNIINGLGGNDTIQGSGGNDIYIYEMGGGSDVLFDIGNSNYDKLVFGPGILPEDLILSRSMNDLVINFSGSTEAVTIQQHYASQTFLIEEIQFDDGTIWDLVNDPQFMLPIVGTDGDDESLSGGSFDDTINGKAGNDNMYGNGGNDTYIIEFDGVSRKIIEDKNGTNIIELPEGVIESDIIYGRTSINNYYSPDYTSQYGHSLDIRFAGRNDRIIIKDYFKSPTPANPFEIHLFGGTTINLDYLIANLQIGDSDDNYISTNEGDDIVYAGGGNDYVFLSDGNDTFYGEGGSDVLQGGDGDDTLNGGSGNDRLYGDAGIDTADYSTSSEAVSIGLLTSTYSGGDATGDILYNIENISGSAHNDNLIGDNNVNVIHGNAGNDIIDGKGGDDSLYGNDGDDIFIGNAGNDIIDGSAGLDTIDYSQLTSSISVYLVAESATGTFNDTLINIENIIGTSYDDILIGDIKNNIINGYGGNDSISGGEGDDTLIVGMGSDIVDGGIGNDTISFENSIAGVNVDLGGVTNSNGAAEGDTYTNIENLSGSSYDDTLIGDMNSNIISGKGGDDVINGGDGSDIIFSGIGNDTLTGGLGNDIFIIESSINSITIIEDFDIVNEILDLSGVNAPSFVNLSIEVDGVNTKITLPNNQLVILNNISPSSIAESNFIGLNTLPVANDDYLNVDEDNDSVINVSSDLLVNDTDIEDGQPLFSSIQTQPANGVLVDNGNGTLTYTPNTNFFGNDSFTYEVVDSSGEITSATANIAVASVNDSPVANSDILSISENAVLDIEVLANDSDIDGGALSIDSVDLTGTIGKVTINLDETINYDTDGKFDYLQVGQQTIDSFDYVVSDGNGGFSSTPVTITINGQNDSPTLVNLSNSIINENSPAGALIGMLSAVDVDSGDSHTFALDPASQALFEIFGNELRTKVALDHETVASYDIQVTVTDQGGLTHDENFTINVNDINENPTDISISNLSVNENVSGAVVGNIIITDPDVGDGHGITVDDNRFEVIVGQLVLKVGESLNYEAEPNVTVNVTATDSGGLSVQQQFVINVNDINEQPLISDTSSSTNEDGLVEIILPVITDPEDGIIIPTPANITLSGITIGAVVVVNANGNVSYTPPADFFGVDTFEYTVTDSGGLESDPKMVTINVASVNDSPVVSMVNETGTEDAVQIITLPAASDIEDGTIAPTQANVTVSNITIGANVIVQADGTINYTPPQNFFGQDTFTYAISDSEGLPSAIQLVTIDVAAVNDKPVVYSFNTDADVNATVTITLPDAADPEDGAIAASAANVILSNITVGATVLVNPDGTISYTPPIDFIGQDSFSYSIVDSGGLASDPVTITIDVPKVLHLTSSDTHAISADVYMAMLDQNLDTIPVIESPDGQTVYPDAISSQRMTIAENGIATVTFKNSVAGYNNSLGWYVIEEDGTIGATSLLFKGAKQIGSGTEFSLGTLAAGTEIGFFVISNGGSSNVPSSGGDLRFEDASGNEVSVYGTETAYLRFDGGTTVNRHVFLSHSNGYLNADNKVHGGAGWDSSKGDLLIGLEDLYGGGDKDYNDILFHLDLGGVSENLKYTTAPGLGGISLTDADQIASAVVEITSGYIAGDQLVLEGYDVDGSNNIVGTGLTIITAATTSTLTGLADSATYQAVINAFRLVNDGASADVSGTREITISVTDEGSVTSSVNTSLHIANNPGADTDGTNSLIGTAENDGLYGRDGDDMINAGDGNDILNGGAGADSLTGGVGADSFDFSHIIDSTVSARDTITDFTRGEDTINLSQLVNEGIINFDDLTVSNDGFNTTIASTDVANDFEVELLGVHNLDDSDFNFG